MIGHAAAVAAGKNRSVSGVSVIDCLFTKAVGTGDAGVAGIEADVDGFGPTGVLINRHRKLGNNRRGLGPAIRGGVPARTARGYAQGRLAQGKEAEELIIVLAVNRHVHIRRKGIELDVVRVCIAFRECAGIDRGLHSGRLQQELTETVGAVTVDGGDSRGFCHNVTVHGVGNGCGRNGTVLLICLFRGSGVIAHCLNLFSGNRLFLFLAGGDADSLLIRYQHALGQIGYRRVAAFGAALNVKAGNVLHIVIDIASVFVRNGKGVRARIAFIDCEFTGIGIEGHIMLLTVGVRLTVEAENVILEGGRRVAVKVGDLAVFEGQDRAVRQLVDLLDSVFGFGYQVARKRVAAEGGVAFGRIAQEYGFKVHAFHCDAGGAIQIVDGDRGAEAHIQKTACLDFAQDHFARNRDVSGCLKLAADARYLRHDRLKVHVAGGGDINGRIFACAVAGHQRLEILVQIFVAFKRAVFFLVVGVGARADVVDAGDGQTMGPDGADLLFCEKFGGNQVALRAGPASSLFAEEPDNVQRAVLVGHDIAEFQIAAIIGCNVDGAGDLLHVESRECGRAGIIAADIHHVVVRSGRGEIAATDGPLGGYGRDDPADSTVGTAELSAGGTCYVRDTIDVDIHADRQCRRRDFRDAADRYVRIAAAEAVVIVLCLLDKHALSPRACAGVHGAVVSVRFEAESIALKLVSGTGDFAAACTVQIHFGDNLAGEAFELGNSSGGDAAAGGIGAGPDFSSVVRLQGTAVQVNVAVHIQRQVAVGLCLTAGALDLGDGVVIGVELLQCGRHVHGARGERRGLYIRNRAEVKGGVIGAGHGRADEARRGEVAHGGDIPLGHVCRDVQRTELSIGLRA